MAAIFRYCLVYNVCKTNTFVNFQEIKEKFIYYYYMAKILMKFTRKIIPFFFPLNKFIL